MGAPEDEEEEYDDGNKSHNSGVLIRQALLKIMACILSLNCYHILYDFNAKKNDDNAGKQLVQIRTARR